MDLVLILIFSNELRIRQKWELTHKIDYTGPQGIHDDLFSRIDFGYNVHLIQPNLTIAFDGIGRSIYINKEIPK